MDIWITKSEQRENSCRYLPGILLEAVLILLVNGCGALVLFRMLVPSLPMFSLLFSTFCTAALCGLIDRLETRTFSTAFLASAAAAVALAAFARPVLEGFLGLWNQIAATLGEKAGIYLTVYQEGTSAGTFSQTAFLVFLGILLGVTGYFVMKLRLYPVPLLFAAVPPVLIAAGDLVPDTRTCLAFYAGVLLSLLYMWLCRTSRMGTLGEILPFLTGTLLLGAAALAGLFALQGLLPRKGYEDSQLVANAKEEALEGLSRFRYQGQKANSLPDGNLKAAGSWTASSDTALKVTMEQPSSLYLRGFVGSVYDGSSWKSLSTEDAYQEKDLFYWLHQDGFYGETQLASARELVEDAALSKEAGSITVQNKTASSRYLYTPYELSGLPDGYTGVRAQADSTLLAKGLFGKRNYIVLSYGNLVKDFTTLGSEIYQVLTSGNPSSQSAFSAEDQKDTKDGPKATEDSQEDTEDGQEGTKDSQESPKLPQEYRQQESYYNALVYQYDTRLPASLEDLFRQELGDGGNREEGHTDYYTAITRIRSYLEKNMTYSSQTESLGDSTDFTENFLKNTRIGHSVHFATAAALMFRYYGIPSRYVEGYLVTPEDVSGKNPGDSIEIPGSNGHAWTEIYLDGLGWVPVEMTPSYYGVMEEADLKTGLEAKGKLAAPVPEAAEEPQAQENIRTNWSLKLALFGIEKFILLFLLVFDIFCFLFICTVFVLRIRANQRRRKRFGSRDGRLAVRAMAGYARELYVRGGACYSSKTMELYREVERIGQRAAFSPHPVSASQRHDAAGCIRRMTAELKRSSGWYDRWIMKYMERLF